MYKYEKYFKDISDTSLKEALSLWEQLGCDQEKYIEITPGAGRPKSEYIDCGEGPPAPLKAVVKQAMKLSGKDPTADSLKEFTSDNAKSWLSKKGYKFISLGGQEQQLASLENWARQKQSIEILARPEQAKFRQSLVIRYQGKCVISQCGCLPVLEAAHIVPVSVGGSDDVENGLLLRADLHRLFDANLLKVHPESGYLFLEDEVKADYPDIAGRKLDLDLSAGNYSAFSSRWSATHSDFYIPQHKARA